MDKPGERRTGRCGCLVVGFLLGLVAAGPLAVWLNMPTNRVLHRWDQPEGVKYGSFEPYSLYIAEGPKKWHILGWSKRRYEIRIVPTGADPNDHGHVFECDLQLYASPSVESHLEHCTVEWTADGVTFTQPTGHKLFIPKDAFIGGR